MPGKFILLTGAPASSSLDWDPSLLLHEFTEPLARFAKQPSESEATPTPPPRASPSSLSRAGDVVWRSIPLKTAHLPTGFSQQHAHLWSTFRPSPKFFTAAAVSLDASPSEHGGSDFTTESVVAQFYEHSLAAYGDIPSSQPASAGGEDSYRTAESSFDDTTVADSLEPGRPPPPAPLGRTGHLVNLDDIPGAAQLTRLEPQTVTVNLIVGVISIAAPRSVRTRWGAQKSLVEVLVGDATSAGFAVTFWLNGPPSDATAKTLGGLRPQDVLLMSDVALHVFRNKVYGSSLPKDMTKVHLLYRRKLDAGDVGGHYSTSDLASVEKRRSQGQVDPQLERTAKVREWVLAFVGTGYGPGREEQGGDGDQDGVKNARPRATKTRRRWDLPPEADTQEL